MNQEIKNYYTCQGCGNDFRSLYELEIIPYYMPICCNKCKFKVIYKWINNLKLRDETLEFLQKSIEKKRKIIQFNRQNAIFSITKHMAKFNLSSIK